MPPLFAELANLASGLQTEQRDGDQRRAAVFPPGRVALPFVLECSNWSRDESP